MAALGFWGPEIGSEAFGRRIQESGEEKRRPGGGVRGVDESRGFGTEWSLE